MREGPVSQADRTLLEKAEILTEYLLEGAMECDRTECELISRIAWAYYVEGMIQSEIAEWLGINRVRVNRLLQVCREENYVQILINTDRSGCFSLERRMEKAYGLTRAVVIPVPANPKHLNKHLGHAAGHYLSRVLCDGCSLGLGWGTTVAAAAEQAPRNPAEGLTVVSLYGGLPHSIVISPNEIVANFSRRLGAAQTYYIAAPMFAPNPETCRLLKSQELFDAIYSQTIKVDVALIGLGELSPTATNVVLGPITQAEVRSLMAAGAVGEVLGNWVNREGASVDHSLNQRFMGPALDEVRAIPLIVAAAGGEHKAKIIKAALRGGFVHALVTDEATAERLLNDSEEEASA